MFLSVHLIVYIQSGAQYRMWSGDVNVQPGLGTVNNYMIVQRVKYIRCAQSIMNVLTSLEQISLSCSKALTVSFGWFNSITLNKAETFFCLHNSYNDLKHCMVV